MTKQADCERRGGWSLPLFRWSLLGLGLLVLTVGGVWVAGRGFAISSSIDSPESPASDQLSADSLVNPGETVNTTDLGSVRRLKRSDLVSNTALVTHDGKSVMFRDDLVKGKKVVINFMYTICNGICPGMTRNILKVRDDLAESGVDDITFISISIEPDRDTPAQLTRYMENNGIENKPGLSPWIFLTGRIEDIDQLRRSLGVYDPDPVIDADRRQHGGMLTYGNDRSDWWGATPALQSPELTVQTLMRNLSSDQRRSPGFGAE
jgi:protein SCO1/2